MSELRADTSTALYEQHGNDIAVVSGGDLGDVLAAAEPVSHIVGSGSAREITGDFRYQYGHMAVELTDELTRAVIDEDEIGERRARGRLALELALLRSDFDAWEAGLREPESDEYFEATGIIADFNLLDRHHLPITLMTPRDTVGTTDATVLAARKRVFSWFQTLSDEQLVNYFQWSEHRTNAVSAALTAARPEIEQNVRTDFDRLITHGLVPEHARDELERSFAYTTTFGALSSFESGFYQAAGFYDWDARRLGVHREFSASEVGKYRKEMHWVFFHESLHAYDAANDTGLTYLLNEDEESLVWVDEAVKEHLSAAGMNGQPFVLNPYERYTEGVYKEIRELLHLVLTGGEFAVDLRTVLAANFEPHDASSGRLARQELLAQLRESYHGMYPDLPEGETILHVIARDINAAPKPLAANVIQDWIQKMTEWRDEQLVDDASLVY